MPSFRAVIQQAGKTATGIPLPAQVVTELGAGKKPAVIVTLGTYQYRSTVATMGGRFLIPLRAEHRAASGLAGGDEVDVALALDERPREVPLPPEIHEALASAPESARAYAAMSYSRQRALIEPIDQAKTEDTRQRRVAKVVAELAAGT